MNDPWTNHVIVFSSFPCAVVLTMWWYRWVPHFQFCGNGVLCLSLSHTHSLSLSTSSVSVSGPPHSHQGTLPTPCHYFNQMQLQPLWGQLSFVDCPFSVTLCPCPCPTLPSPSAHHSKHTHRQQLSQTRIKSLKVRQACGIEETRRVKDWKHISVSVLRRRVVSVQRWRIWLKY